MTLGIIGAMSQEVDGLIELISDVKTKQIGSIEFHEGKISGKSVVLAKCGIGKVFAAICTQTMILEFAPDLIINVGVAGGHYKKTEIGDLVIAESTVQHDMDTSPLGDPIGMISGINIINIPCSEIVSKQIVSMVENMNVQYRQGIIATGDKFICDNKDVKKIADTFNAIAFDMESGSIAQVCYVNNTKCCILRSISDNGDESADVDFTQFVDKAAKLAIKIVVNYIREYR